MRQVFSRHRNAIAVLTGLVLGWWWGYLAFFGESATGLLLFLGFIITPLPVCLIAGRRGVPVAIIPVMVSQVILLTLSYQHAYKPTGTTLQVYLDTRVYPHCWWWVLWWIPAVITATLFYAIKSERKSA